MKGGGAARCDGRQFNSTVFKTVFLEMRTFRRLCSFTFSTLCSNISFLKNTKTAAKQIIVFFFPAGQQLTLLSHYLGIKIPSPLLSLLSHYVCLLLAASMSDRVSEACVHKVKVQVNVAAVLLLLPPGSLTVDAT